MRIKPSDVIRFLAALVAAVLVLTFVAWRVTSSAPRATPGPAPATSTPPGASAASFAAASPPPPVQIPMAPASASCAAPAFEEAARANTASLRALAWAPFRRAETGWETYAPLIGREIGTGCGPQTGGFAQALADWQGRQRLPATGILTDPDFQRLNGVIQTRRPFVQLSARKICPDAPDSAALEWSREDEGYGGKKIQLRPAAFAAWRRMVLAARADEPAIAADPRNLQIFSGFRSPADDLAHCVTNGGCDGVSRAVACSPHRTGLAMDIYVGQAPGFGPDSSADPNRLFMSGTPTYRWLVANADRFGFVNYPFEPWHWEWTGEAP
jgi:D-alanyl-D-alanine carboxypeptidase